MVGLKMPDINSVMIAGNLTSDPSFRKTTNGTPVANFCIASNRKFKDNSGQWRENVCFIGVVAWHKLAESCCEFLSKGSAVLIEGELQSRSWRNDDGSSNNVVEIKARRIQFLDKQSRKGDSENFDENGLKLTDNVSDHSNSEPRPARNGQLQSQTDELNDGNPSVPSDSEYNFGYQDSKL